MVTVKKYTHATGEEQAALDAKKMSNEAVNMRHEAKKMRETIARKTEKTA